MPTIAERVQRGVVYLDDVKANWVDKIDLDKLDMRLPDICILGQLYGNYWTKIRNLEFSNSQSSMLGLTIDLSIFSACPDIILEEYEELTEEWKKVITERRQQMAV